MTFTRELNIFKTFVVHTIPDQTDLTSLWFIWIFHRLQNLLCDLLHVCILVEVIYASGGYFINTCTPKYGTGKLFYHWSVYRTYIT